MSEFIPVYDLDSLNESQRQDYVRHLCKHLGVPPELNLVMLTYIDSADGPRRLVPYAKRGAAEIIRNTHKINVEQLTHVMVGGSIVFTAVGKNTNGRQEIATGSKYIDGLTGNNLDDGIMTAQTRAVRRMTLQFIGGGVLDESEVNGRGVTIAMKSESAQVPALQPAVIPNSEPGKDITEAKVEFHVPAEIDKEKGVTVTLLPNSGDTVKIVPLSREDAIAQLNQKAEEEKPAEPRKRRGRGKAKSKVDLGPSEQPIAPAVKPEPVAPTVAPPVLQVVTPTVIVPTAPPSVPVKPQLTAAEVQPYRTRLFQLVNDLESAGFAPKEGMGNSDKMRQFASVVFGGVVNFKELTIDQWERYLSTLENKVKADGPAATIKYIEETIGL